MVGQIAICPRSGHEGLITKRYADGFEAGVACCPMPLMKEPWFEMKHWNGIGVFPQSDLVLVNSEGEV